MLRSAPIRRKTWMPRRRKTPRRSGRVRDPLFLSVVRLFGCYLTLFYPHRCSWRIEADHGGRRPVGRKANDRTCLPMCSAAHGWRTRREKYFDGWDDERMRAWLDEGEGAVTALAASRGFLRDLRSTPSAPTQEAEAIEAIEGKRLVPKRASGAPAAQGGSMPPQGEE